ncbi:MAG: SPOR domain-containing protein [Rhodothermales bacterium]
MNLEAEIASRLGVTPTEVRPVLESVIERIRQQVAHYGYARLAGLGTFRGQNGSVSFEPDPGLSESVNLRFAGLSDIQVEVPGAPPSVLKEEPRDEEVVPIESPWIEETEPVETSGFVETEDAWPARETSLGEMPESAWQEEADIEKETAVPQLQDEFPMPGEDIVDRKWREEADWTEGEEQEYVAPPEYEEEPEAGGYEELEGPPFARADVEPPVSFENEFDESYDAPASPPLEPAEPVGSWPSEFESSDWANEAEEEIRPSWSAREEDQSDAPDDDEPGVTWQESIKDEAEHPLGPRPAEQFEEADFSFIIDRERSGESDEAWVPLGVGGDREATPKAPERGALHQDRIRREPYGGRAGTAAPDRRMGVWIGAAVVVVIAVAAIAYFIFRPGEPQSPPLIDQTPLALTDSAAAPDTTATQPEVTAVVPDPAEEEPAEAAAPIQAPVTESTPLRSADGIEASRGGYTIVVYSETSSEPAEATAQRFRNSGYRTGVLQSRDGGVTRYRVGIGQFRSAGEATRARDSLAGKEIPEDAWVYRIR